MIRMQEQSGSLSSHPQELSVTSSNLEHQFSRVVEDLSAEFAAVATRDDVLGIVNGLRAELEPAAKITEYLPVLVRRFAREALQARRSPVAV